MTIFQHNGRFKNKRDYLFIIKEEGSSLSTVCHDNLGSSRDIFRVDGRWSGVATETFIYKETL